MQTKLVELMKQASVVGAGGAGFPSYAKIADGADTLVVNAAECEPLTYTDLTAIADWALEGVHYCTSAKYLSGTNNAFNPAGTATRAMVAQVFMNMAG